jgi:hypothetical protein
VHFRVIRPSLKRCPEPVPSKGIRHANELPNLQLLEGAINNEKRAAMPAGWLAEHLPDRAAQLHYRTKHELGDLPVDLLGFEAFHSARRERLEG